jgi:glyoxylase-like metal-dependent hydrolase (beta-lactamase superfamily II)
VQEGSKIIVDDITLTVIETPGHYDDHICFLMEEPG